MKEKIKARILSVLLTERQPLSMYRLAKLAGASFSWTHEFLGKLEQLGMVKQTKVKKPEKLIGYWLSFSKKPKYREYMLQKPLDILKDMRLEYAITTYYAENLMQKYLFPSRLDIYVKEGDMQKWHTLVMRKGLYGKGNVRLLVSNGQMFRAQKIKGLTVVSIPQLIVDLKIEGGPCEEAAQMLMKRLKDV
jgi:DNA-binding Lrp family transcriptional regulator